MVVKTDIAEAQKNEITEPSDSPPPTNPSPVIKDPDPIPLPTPPISPKLEPKNFRGSIKLDPTTASLKTSQFMSEVMSHLQALPDSEIEMTLEINVKNENGIDQQTARIILENSITLKVDNPEIF